MLLIPIGTSWGSTGVGRGNESLRAYVSAYQAISGTGLGAAISEESEVEALGAAAEEPRRRRLLLLRLLLGSWEVGENGDAVHRNCEKRRSFGKGLV